MNLMNKVFKQYSNLFVNVSIDDIPIVSSNSFIVFLQNVKDRYLSTKFSKYEFWLLSVAFMVI